MQQTLRQRFKSMENQMKEVMKTMNEDREVIKLLAQELQTVHNVLKKIAGENNE